MVSVGFTGTQDGMTQIQQYQVAAVLTTISSLYVGESCQFHHGDCIGADTQAHLIALRLGYEVMIHPPLNPKKRAFCNGATFVFPERDYPDRNHDIVHASHIVIATPKEMEDVPRGSGTWATIRYATKRNINLLIVYPDGQIEQRRRTA